MIAKDKQLHFLVSFNLVILFSLFFNLQNAVIITFIIGTVKEMYDYFVAGRSDCYEDLFANFIGMSLAILVL